VGGRARERASQTDRTREKRHSSRCSQGSARQDAIDAPAPVEKTDGGCAKLQRRLTRDPIAQTRRGQEGGGKTYALLVIHTPTKDQPVTSETSTSRWTGRNYGRRGARRQLLAALQSQSDDPQSSVAALSAIWSRSSNVQGVEERSVGPSDLSSARNPNRSPYFHCVLAYCLLVTLKQRLKTLRRIDGEGRARKNSPRLQHDRYRTAHHGRSAGRLVPLYRAGRRISCVCFDS